MSSGCRRPAVRIVYRRRSYRGYGPADFETRDDTSVLICKFVVLS